MKNIYDYIFYHYYLMVKTIYGKKRSNQFEDSSVAWFTLTELSIIWYILSYSNIKLLIVALILILVIVFFLVYNNYCYNSIGNKTRIEQLKKKYTYLENSHKYLRVLITVIVTIVIWGLALSRL